MNQLTNEMVTFAVMPIIDIGNSNRIEKLNFTKVLNELKQKKNLCKSTDIQEFASILERERIGNNRSI